MPRDVAKPPTRGLATTTWPLLDRSPLVLHPAALWLRPEDGRCDMANIQVLAMWKVRLGHCTVQRESTGELNPLMKMQLFHILTQGNFGQRLYPRGWGGSLSRLSSESSGKELEVLLHVCIVTSG